MAKIPLNKLVQAYKAARAVGITFSDICKLINWNYAHALAAKLGNPIVKVVVRFAEFACSLAPESQEKLLAMLDEEVDTFIT